MSADDYVRDKLGVLSEEAHWRKYRRVWTPPLVDLWQLALEYKDTLGDAFWDLWMEGYAEGMGSEYPWLVLRGELISGWSDLGPIPPERIVKIAGMAIGAYRLSVRPKR